MLTIYETPGHGYLAVTGDLAETARECSTGYDYERNGTIYLEEDVSAPLFLRTVGLWERGDTPLPIPTRQIADIPSTWKRIGSGTIGAAYLAELFNR